MITQIMDQFKRCQQELKHLINQRIIPNSMQRKLKYLESLILNKHNQAAFVDLLPDFQRFSLDQMNKDTRIAFFINIINCFTSSKMSQNVNQANNQRQQAYSAQILRDNLIEEQIQHLKSIKTKIENQVVNADKFKLARNIPHGKIQINQINNSVRMLLFVQNCQIKEYIQSYLMFDCWNTQVEAFKILKQIRKNSYLAFIKLKRYNMWTSQRYAYILITYLKECQCFLDQSSLDANKENRKHCILIKSIQYDQPSKQSAVKMDFNQVVSFNYVEDNHPKIFITVVSNIDYNVYQLLAKKNEINMNIIKDVPSISILYKQRSIQKSNPKYIQFDHCGCTFQKKFSHISLPLQVEEQQISSVNQQIFPIKQSVLVYEESQIIKIIKDQVNDFNNKKIIQLIKKKVYESYYLRQRFQLQIDQRPYIESKYSLHERRNFLLNNGRWQLNKNDQYVFIDQNQLAIQKGMLKIMIKQITSNILAGKSIMTMSLPVEIFDRKSTLEGVVDILGFVPKYMNDATNTSDVIEQMKNVAAAFMFIFACRPTISKPFNPILGQTYQAFIGGIPVFVEQISHHPPISAFYMKSDKFQAYGNFDLHIDLGLNAAYSKIYGVYHAKIFATNTQFVIKYPDIEMGGVMFGDRSLKPKGRGYILQKNNNIYFEYTIGKDSKKVYQYQKKLKPSELGGGIFKVTKQYTNKVLNQDKKKSPQGIKSEDIVQKYCQVSGKWYGNLYFDNKLYKSLQNGPYPLAPQRPAILLPSDMLFREDIIYKKWGDNKRSNQEKQRLQNLQRRDRKLRQKFTK